MAGTLIAALYQINSERKRRHETEQEALRRHRRQQAEAISGWPDGRSLPSTPLILLNRSDQPVYEIVATLVMIQGGGARRGEDQLPAEFRKTLSVLPPGRWRVEVAGGWAGMSARPGLELAFTDRSGVHWVRRANGVLQEISEAAIDYYGLGRPQELAIPEPDDSRPPGADGGNGSCLL